VRILVLGASGQLGRELLRSRDATAKHELVGLQEEHCDIRKPGSVDAALNEITPDAVINCAAWTRVDEAERQPEAAFAVNQAGAANVARACAARRVVLCHMSTDYVFDGSQTSPMDESVEPQPINVYGRSKLAGELEVSALLPDRHLIVRTAWLFGQQGPNFVMTILRRAREGGQMRVVDDQMGSPTWTGHLAPAVVRALDIEARGTLHLTAAGSTTWYGFAKAIVADGGVQEAAIEPIAAAEYPTPARRPTYSVLDNRRWRELGQQPLPPWRDGLRGYLEERS